MSVQILESEDGTKALYCSSTMWAFGGLFYEDEDPINFLKFVLVDVRTLSDSEFESKQSDWRKAHKEINDALSGKQICKEFVFALDDVGFDCVDIEDDPNCCDAELITATHDGVYLVQDQLDAINFSISGIASELARKSEGVTEIKTVEDVIDRFGDEKCEDCHHLHQWVEKMPYGDAQVSALQSECRAVSDKNCPVLSELRCRRA